MNELPMFEDPAPPVEPEVKKPRRKPMKRKSAKVAVPAKKRRKKQVTKVVKTPRLAVMFDACARISDVLRGLTPKERTAVIESIGHVA